MSIIMTLQHTLLPVIGFSEETRALQLDEGEASTLTVQVLKPAVGTPATELAMAIGFQMDNTANIGKSIFQRDMCSYQFLKLIYVLEDSLLRLELC